MRFLLININNMVSAKLSGGLGNQMFQIATATALAIRNNDVSRFNLNTCHTPLQGKPANNYKNNIFRNIDDAPNNFLKIDYVYKEPYFNFKEIKYVPNIQIDGYFQSEKYFKDQTKDIKKIFDFDEETKRDVKKFLSLLDGKKLTSVHVRRGDYLKFPNIHPTCDVNYYNNAISLIGDNYFIFISDDPQWVVENFKGDNIKYSIGNSDVFDLCLMTLCDNNIIANSSFSWWGAWLNNNLNKKIIAPKLWFNNLNYDDYKDIYGESWIVI